MLHDSGSLKKDKSVIPGVKVNATTLPSVKQNVFSKTHEVGAHIKS